MTYVIAHRGASNAERENTIAAFQAAKDAGADWVELDIRRTRDGVLVVHHDAHVPNGPAIIDVDAAALPDWLPSLAEALEACEGMGVNIEVKNDPSDPDYDTDFVTAAAVAGLVVAYRPYDEIVVSSFDADAVGRVRAIDPEIRTAIVAFDPISVEQNLARCEALGHAALHPHVSLVTPRLVERAHELGLALSVWTVDDPEKMRELVDLGVDGIMTDDPHVLRDIVDAHDPTPPAETG